MANLFSPPRKVDCDLPIGENANLIFTSIVKRVGGDFSLPMVSTVI